MADDGGEHPGGEASARPESHDGDVRGCRTGREQLGRARGVFVAQGLIHEDQIGQMTGRLDDRFEPRARDGDAEPARFELTRAPSARRRVGVGDEQERNCRRR